MKRSDKINKRFWNKTFLGKNGCIEWNGAKSKSGYGRFNYDGKNNMAHRISYKLMIGSIPKNKCVLHKCDNRPCVNPDHLFIGTQLENIKDMVNKNRQSRLTGARNPRAKLTRKKVEIIRNSIEKNKYLSNKFGVTVAMIRRIKIREAWND